MGLDYQSWDRRELWLSEKIRRVRVANEKQIALALPASKRLRMRESGMIVPAWACVLADKRFNRSQRLPAFAVLFVHPNPVSSPHPLNSTSYLWAIQN